MNNQDKEEMIFELLDDFTSGGKLYYDDEYSSIFMINPETKKWIFEFKKSGDLWYSYPTFVDIFKYISMEYPDFTPYITKWVGRILQNEVKNTGVFSQLNNFLVGRILQNEVKNTVRIHIWYPPEVERILQNEVKNTTWDSPVSESHVERILQKEVKDTRRQYSQTHPGVERILQNEIKNT